MTTKFINNDAQDALLSWIADNGSKIYLCDAKPTNYTEASTNSGSGGFALGNYTLNAGVGAGDYEITDGTGADGRKLKVGNGVKVVTITVTGTATYIAITNGTDTLAYVSEIPQKLVAAAVDENVGEWFIEVEDPR